MRFHADVVEVSVSETMANVFFADSTADESDPKVLSMARPIEFPDSTYYYEVADQSGGRYGGLASAVLSRGSLVLQPEDGDEVAVTFEVDDALFGEVADGLVAVFGDLLQRG